MKRKIFFVFLLVIIILSGCSLFKKKAMDEASDDGSYKYQNKDLGFSLVLPKEFIYYQTQSKKGSDYVDLEIFVPTSDATIVQEVEDYAKPIQIRVFSKEGWQRAEAEDDNFNEYKKVGENKKSIYTLRFWSHTPSDWASKWTTEMMDNLFKNFKVL